SRFAAGTIDVFILSFAFVAVTLVVMGVAAVSMPHGDEEVQAFGLAVVGAYTGLLALYYLGFEWLWDGQTPGKRALKLRVISQDGVPASAGAVFVRNILRVVDLPPFCPPYGLAGVVMFCNRRSQRL